MTLPGREVRRGETAEVAAMVEASCWASGAMFPCVLLQAKQADSRVLDAFLWVSVPHGD